MKILLNEIDGFKTYAELQNCDTPSNLQVLRIYTHWDIAKFPHDQVKCELFLTEEAKQRLIELLK